MDVVRRRALAGAAAVAALGLLLAGCTTSGSPGADHDPTPSPSTSPPAQSEPVTLQLSVYGDRAMRAAYRKLADAYTEQHPHVTIAIQSSRTADESADKVERSMAAGDGPDVFVASNTELPELVAAGRVQPVDQMLEERGVRFGDSYQRVGLEALSAESALQCMPYDVSPLVVFYHRGLVPFRRLTGPDEDPLTPATGWTWDQFARAARMVTDKDKGVKGAYVEPQLDTLLALIRTSGDDLVDDPRTATTTTFADSGTRSALEEVLSVVRDPQVMPTQRQLEREDGLTRFEEGKIGMLVGSRSLVPQLRQAEDLDFDVYPLPRLARPLTVASVTGLCISSGTEKVAPAADFLAFATGGEGASILAETGEVVPAHVPTLNSRAFTQPELQPESAHVFDTAVSQSTTVPFVPGWSDLAKAMHPDLRGMFYDPLLDLDTTLSRLDAESEELLRPRPR